MSTGQLLLWGVGLLAAGAVASLCAARRRLLAGWLAFAAIVAAAVPLGAAVVRGFGGGTSELNLLALPRLGARLNLAVDPLSAFFLLIALVIAVAASLFSVRYMTHYGHDGVAKFYPVLLFFFVSVVGVLAVTDLLFFLVFWELMTLTSFVLVTFERQSRSSQRAGLKYFVITHAATLCMVAATLLLWRRVGSFELSDLRTALGSLLVERPLEAHLVLFLFFLGFATKAGVLPMGDWLPDAHPVAPTGVSAVLSGALVKLGIYGLLRVFCGLLPPTSGGKAWGTFIALAGTASLFVGTLTALRQSDSKRLMAFHTIGQIGYVCLGLGVGVALLADRPALAAIALAGALFHAANHACFKACLFLGAGAVLFRTGERDMDRLGGLGHDMPVTAGTTAVAALSIAGVPPLNGFASKWLIVCACVLSGVEHPLFVLLGLVAMFISLATLASFLKVLGAVFLGPASESRRVSEVPPSMAIPQVVLAALCVLLGVVPQLPLALVARAVASATPTPLPLPDALFGGPLALALAPTGLALALWSPLILVAGIGILTLGCWALQRAGGAQVRDVAMWSCGEEHPAEMIRYPASSFYVPFKHAFASIYPRFSVHPPSFPPALRRVFDTDSWFYLPVARLVERASRATSHTHVGVPQIYLAWIVTGAAVLIVALLLAAH